MLNWLDILIAIPLGISIFKGFQKGLVVSLFSLVGIFIGIYAAIHFSTLIEAKIQNIFSVSANWLPVVAFCVLLVGVYLAIMFVAKAIEKLLDVVALGLANKIGGALFNAIKTILIVGSILVVFDNYSSTNPIISIQSKKESVLYHPICKTSKLIIPALKSSELLQPIINLKDELKLK